MSRYFRDIDTIIYVSIMYCLIYILTNIPASRRAFDFARSNAKRDGTAAAKEGDNQGRGG